MAKTVVVNHIMCEQILERYDIDGDILYLTIVYRDHYTGKPATKCFRIGEEIT